MFWTYAVWNIGYHAVFSITIPIALTELAFPAWRNKPWLGQAGTIVAGAIYAVNAAGIGLLWWTFVQPTLLHVPARVHPVQQGATISLVIALIAAARLAARTRTSTTGGPPPPAAGWLAGAAAGGATAWFGLLLLLSVSGNHLHWLPFPVPIAAAAAKLPSPPGHCGTGPHWGEPCPADRRLTFWNGHAGLIEVVAGQGEVQVPAFLEEAEILT